jgi:DNA segregation ATPase FtsK/SpoIIIE, S-DNA-T family
MKIGISNPNHKKINPQGLNIRQRLIRDIGFGIIAMGAFLSIIANISYNPADPSWNVATSQKIQNVLGSGGAIIADISQQLFGLNSYFLALSLIGMSVFALLKGPHNIAKARLRFFATILGIVFLGAAMAALPQNAKWPISSGYGGILGDFTLGSATLFFDHTNIARTIFGLFYLLLFFVCAYFSFNLRARDIDSAWDELTYYYSGLRVWIDEITKPKPKMHKKTPAAKIKVAPVNRAPLPVAPKFEETIPVQPLAKAQNIGIEIPKKTKISNRAQDEIQPDLPWEKKEGFELPHLEFLTKPPARNTNHDEAALRQNALMLMSVLNQFKVQGQIINVRPGPVVTLYELEPEAGTKSSRVIGIADDIARSMAAISCRVAVVKGRNAIGIELPNSIRESVYLRSLLASRDFERNNFDLPIALGENIGGEAAIVDLAKMPHVLIAGTTGSGKSVGINAMILSLLYRLTPEECRLIMIDPKRVELSIYNDIPHLLAPVVVDPKQAVAALKWTVREMENRYNLMSKVGVRNITGFNERAREAMAKGETFDHIERTGWNKETGEAILETRKLEIRPMPFIVVVIDEMADLMMTAGKEIEASLQRLAQMARAVGIHLITATQRPSVDVITGTIKANFPTRISYALASKTDSRTILGEGGADQLLGAGDLLYMANGGKILRLHGPFVSDDEVRKIVNALKAQGKPQYFEDITSISEEESDSESGMNNAFGGSSGDELFDKAVEIVATTRKVSTSFLQRQLKLGYNRAADLVDRMERENMISAPDHVGRRQVLLPDHKDY